VTRTVRVEADLTAAVAGGEVEVRGYGDRLVLDFPSFAAARRARGAVDALPLPVDATSVPAADLAVDVRVRGASVARLAADAGPGPLSRLAGVAPARLSLLGVCRALLRRND
jgi:hypothetical protein